MSLLKLENNNYTECCLENQEQIYFTELPGFHENDKNFLQEKSSSSFSYCIEKSSYSLLIEVTCR